MAEFDNPFVLDKKEYKRDLNVVKHYVDDAARFLSIMTNQPYDECREYVMKSIKPGGNHALVDPEVKMLERGENGDRRETAMPLSSYLSSSIRNGDLIAPTMTTYVHPRERQSLLVDYIDENVKARGVAKKAMFVAEMEKNMPVYIRKEREQALAKISNNAISGAHVSSSTPLFNKTAHSTLTSTCRCTSGYGNANNEKMLSGNRHYWHPTILLNNIVSIINHTDYAQMQAVIEKYGMVYPSVKDVMECIYYSTKLYFNSPKEMAGIKELVEKLTPIQRAAFVYTGDLYHIAKHNDGVVRNFLGRLITYPEQPVLDPKLVFDGLLEDYRNLAMQLCERHVKGKQFKDLKGTPEYVIVAAAAENLKNVMADHFDFIRTFFVSQNVPASLAFFPSSIRRAALVSDTDSTIFTVQDWVKWYFGNICFGPEANAISATMIFLASQAIVHILAKMSANFGIEQKRLFQIAMKNEFKFDVFVTTQIAKHYFALIGCQEGNLFEEYKKEIKGVHLKSSTAPKKVTKQATDMMIRIMQTVLNGESIELSKILKEIADTEREIIASIKAGSHEYFRYNQIKQADAYKKSPSESPYIHYLLWDEVFAPKYGSVTEVPYSVIKINGMVNSPTLTKEWIQKMGDRELADRLTKWMEKYGKRCFGTFQVPYSCVQTHGIPAEIMKTVDIRSMVKDATGVFTIILESLGYYYSNDKITRLVSDEY